jgi:Glucodextranase, domain N
VLSDVYEPTIDNTDVSTLQYIVTDGATFTDLQARDMTYTVAADPTGMACTVTSTDTKHVSGWSPRTSPTRPATPS